MASQRLASVFSRCKAANRSALITYLTAGDPNTDESETYLNTMAEHADIIEIGMPFSDPMADGPVIQAASERALAAGCSINDVFTLCQKVRQNHPDVGIVLMGYANIPYSMGFDVFAQRASDAGADAVLLVDIPPEESCVCRDALQQQGLSQIFLLAPTSSPARVSQAIAQASGFIYYVTLTGITGAEIDMMDDIEQRVCQLRQQSNVPICVGFGIKTPEQAKKIAHFSDGVIIGSAFVSKITAGDRNISELNNTLRQLGQTMRSAMERNKS